MLEHLLKKYGIEEYFINEEFRLCDELIIANKSNPINKETSSRYTEVHHIVPRCMGGKDDDENLVRLFGADHVKVHFWMTFFTTGEFFERCLFAFQRTHLCVKPSEIVNIDIEASEIEKVKEMCSEKTSKRLKGVPKTEEHKRKISLGNTGKIRSDEYKKNMSLVKMGTLHSEESKEKIRQSSLLRRHSDETKMKLSKLRSGENNPQFGKPSWNSVPVEVTFSDGTVKQFPSCGRVDGVPTNTIRDMRLGIRKTSKKYGVVAVKEIHSRL